MQLVGNSAGGWVVRTLLVALTVFQATILFSMLDMLEARGAGASVPFQPWLLWLFALAGSAVLCVRAGRVRHEWLPVCVLAALGLQSVLFLPLYYVGTAQVVRSHGDLAPTVYRILGVAGLLGVLALVIAVVWTIVLIVRIGLAARSEE